TEFCSGNTDLLVISEGLTTDSSNSITKKENLKHNSLNTVYHWVLDAWNKISKDIIIQAFKKCGVSNCLLGSKDHLIYATDNESDEDKIEDFDNDKEKKFDEDNEDKEFDKNEEFNKIKESDKDNESDSDESDNDESDSNKSN
ncbi:17538_t:CDS:2, partial [Gigaspora margarita]